MFNISNRSLKLLFVPVLLILSIGLLAACSSSSAGDGDGGETAADGEHANGADGAGPVTFDVSMGDNFFEAREFTVSPGQQVTFDLVNDGIAVHNMRVAGEDGDYNSDDDTVSDPDLFLGGDTGTLVWAAPDESGEIVFRCDFHPIEMIGTITVE